MCNKSDIAVMLKTMQGLKSCPITGDNLSEIVDSFHADLGDFSAEVLAMAGTHYRTLAVWFPTPGQIRESASELQMFAFGVPSADEAWAEVLAPEQSYPSVFCSEGAVLRDAISNGLKEYGVAVGVYGDHRKRCDICADGGLRKEYSHPAVKAAIGRMGGIDAILTTESMRGADRARFQDAYEVFIAKEKKLAIMPPALRGYVEQQKQAYLSGSVGSEINLLSERIGV